MKIISKFLKLKGEELIKYFKEERNKDITEKDMKAAIMAYMELMKESIDSRFLPTVYLPYIGSLRANQRDAFRALYVASKNYDRGNISGKEFNIVRVLFDKFIPETPSYHAERVKPLLDFKEDELKAD